MTKRIMAYCLFGPGFVTILFLLYSCNNGSNETGTVTDPVPVTPVINYAVVNRFLHDTTAYTEGLLIHNGQLFESTGAPEGLDQTRSLIGITNPSTGKMDVKIELDRTKYFGEGICILNNKLYQLTYKNQLCFVYDARSFKPITQFKYSNTEGWSLATNGKHLIMSDGTDQLTFINPDNFTPVKRLAVTENGMKRDSLNELEYINGFIYANVWLTNHIVKIDTATGKVVGKLDLSPLSYEVRNQYANAETLNGIAYDSVSHTVFVTGKLWPGISQLNFPH